ncbi:DMT family transporter [Sneathiella marina]|uniref:DMT family transporter n=1 Tax=Sneathiella marina TaxID=2950108 RepID=A0ABY4W809_9PROT|nr:DMT family transporter [Sneathiella marina]USG63198.1 DMT family transporter [Sneathiella marina]
MKTSGASSDLWPSLGIIGAGILWGLFWLPVRALGDLGLEGAWPGIVMYAGAALFLSPVLVVSWKTIRPIWKPLALSGLFTGAAFACYATSLLFTEVIRTILLFYLTPVWGTLLGIIFLGEKFTLSRAIALVSGLGGLLVVIGLGTEFPWPRNLGDWLALIAGMFWALGTMLLYRMGTVATLAQSLSFVCGALVVTGGALLLGGDIFGATPSPAQLVGAIPFGLLAALYVIPMLILTVWPATRLSPARVGILLMSEVVVGVGSAALLSGEPFGLREVIGTCLIAGAGIIEVLGQRSK